MKTTKNFVTFFILSFPFLKYNELHSQGWNACMDAPEYCGSGGSGKSIGEQVEWWQSILIIIVVSLIIFQIFKKLDSTPIKVTVGIIGGLIIFSAIPKEVWGVIIPAWMVISYIMWKMSGSPDLERNDSSYNNVHKKQANKPRVIKKEEHSDSIIQKNTNIVPTFKADIIKPFISSIINDKYKSYSLLCILSLVNLSIVEGQKINEFYNNIKDIVIILESKKHWLSFFVSGYSNYYN